MQMHEFMDLLPLCIRANVNSPNLMPINLFYNLYLFKFHNIFGKCKLVINIALKLNTDSVKIYHTTAFGTFTYLNMVHKCLDFKA